MELTRAQEQGLKIAVERYNNKEAYTVVAGYAGVGKAQPINTTIPTPRGQKKLGDIQIGDYVFDRQGKPTKVLGVFPQGVIDAYKIQLADGRETIAGAEHIWTVIDKHNRWREVTTEELIAKGLHNSVGYKYAIPNNGPVQYPTQNLEVDPYVIGAFLGDGCCKERQLTLSSQDELIPNIIGKLINAIPIRNNQGNYNWNFLLPEPLTNHGYTKTKVQTKELFSAFIQELCGGAEEKRIPSCYKYSSIEQRLALLQGLFDTDGSISQNDGNRFNIRYTSINLNLIKDIQEVLNSLGYHATIQVDTRNEKYKNGVCYNLCINIPNEEKCKLFRMSRKYNIALQAQKHPKHKIYSKISITDITFLGQEEMVCIYVDNDEHLYLTNDYIVTHNTTLIQYIIAALGLYPSQVAYIAYTGKAAQVLRKKGCSNAMTAHRLLYKSVPQRDGTFKHIPKDYIGDYKLIVVDEVSMLPMQMWKLLMSHKIHVIACGDPGQLPPIGEENGILDHPHIFLDEIMRQAEGSEIIRLSADIRAGKSPQPYRGQEINIVRRKDMVDGMLIWADQVLCGKNATRYVLNDYMRRMRWGEHIETTQPLAGDKLICLRNDWDKVTQAGDALVNGTIGTLNHIKSCKDDFMLGKEFIIDFIPEDMEEDGLIDVTFRNVLTDWKLLTTHEPTINKENYRSFPRWLHLNQFDYGYAVTCHKAQGSEYEKVLVVEEMLKNTDHVRWLYTACTRAASKLTLVLKD